MKKKVTDVDPKYVAMLNKAYEKYSRLEVVNSTHERDSCEDKEKLFVEDMKRSTTISPLKENKSQVKSKTSSVDDKKAKIINRANYGRKRFSEEENELILKYLETKSADFDQTQAAKELTKLLNGRTFHSIRRQIRVLLSRQTISAAPKTRKLFNLTEDKFLIDEAIKHLQLCKSLRETIIQNPLEVSKSLKRRHDTINERWDPVIKCWLLQYYNKCSNQEIRPMLVDLIYKNFESIIGIDWEFVVSHKEFSGYNIKGLKRMLVKTVDKAAHYLNKPSYQLTMKEIANYTEENFTDKKYRVGSTSEERKMNCIAYFEQKISELNISFAKT